MLRYVFAAAPDGDFMAFLATLPTEGQVHVVKRIAEIGELLNISPTYAPFGVIYGQRLFMDALRRRGGGGRRRDD